MRTSLIILAFLFAGRSFADVDPNVKRIFDDISFVAYQVSLDFKPQEQAQQPLENSKTNTSRHKKENKIEKTAVSIEPNPTTRQFTGTTVWGDLSVKILDYGTRMVLQVKSSAPAQGWMLQQGDSNHILFKGNVESNALSFQISIPHQYSPDLGLTVIVNSADGQNPAFIALK